MEVNLCKQFTALTPLTLRKEKAREVFLLAKRYNNYLKSEAKETNKTNKSGKRVIRRPAGDDWF